MTEVHALVKYETGVLLAGLHRSPPSEVNVCAAETLVTRLLLARDTSTESSWQLQYAGLVSHDIVITNQLIERVKSQMLGECSRQPCQRVAMRPERSSSPSVRAAFDSGHALTAGPSNDDI